MRQSGMAAGEDKKPGDDDAGRRIGRYIKWIVIANLLVMAALVAALAAGHGLGKRIFEDYLFSADFAILFCGAVQLVAGICGLFVPAARTRGGYAIVSAPFITVISLFLSWAGGDWR